jgi:hypothetical protein
VQREYLANPETGRSSALTKDLLVAVQDAPSSAKAIVRALRRPARHRHAVCRPCNRPMPRRREIKAVVRGGAYRRSLLNVMNEGGAAEV